MDSLPPDAPAPRLCHLIKWPDFDGFGFNLQLGQNIGKVDDDSPAQLADLREGDMIIEVNGVSISNENHKQVVQRIKQIPNETKLLVIDASDYDWYKARDLVIKSTQPNIKYTKTPVPRPTANNVNNNNYYYYNNEDENVQNGDRESNASTKEDRSSDSPLTEEIMNALEEKKNENKQNDTKIEEVANKLESTNLQNDTIDRTATSTATIESNNNSEKAANQNLISPVKSAVAKPHNFIVVNSEEQFANEKRLKDEKMKNNSTPIRSKDEPNHNHLNISASNISNISNAASNTSTNNLSNNNQPSSIDINLNMSVSEMRKLIASRKNVKAECKKAPIDLRQKYEIIQQM